MTESKIRIIVVPVTLILIAVLATLVAWQHYNSGKAEATGTLTVGLDFKTLSTDPGTYGSTLPTFEKCVDVNTTVNNGIFYMDLFVLNVTQLQAMQASLTFTSPGIHILQADQHQFFGAGSNVSVYSTPGSADSNGNITSPAGGYGGGGFEVSTFDTGGGHSGSGVLVRFKGQGNSISGGALVNFSIDVNPSISKGVTLTDATAAHPGGGGDGLFDGPWINQTGGRIAVNGPDQDGDGASGRVSPLFNGCDNCPANANANQADIDGDGLGDVCDSDMDGDGIANGSDTCPTVNDPTNNPASCLDSDGDGILNGSDNCPNNANANQANNDGDSMGDVCDPDDDNDGVNDNAPDNCVFIANPTQADWNNNGIGDACQDSDGDNWMDNVDNCKGLANPSQTNSDTDLYGNICDNCPTVNNNDQADTDGDFVGDACDDDDGDGWMANVEYFVTTNPLDRCANTTTRNDEATDAVPTDNNDDRSITILDVSVYSAAFGSTGPNLPYKKRLDLNIDNRITIIDVSKFSSVFGTTCTP